MLRSASTAVHAVSVASSRRALSHAAGPLNAAASAAASAAAPAAARPAQPATAQILGAHTLPPRLQRWAGDIATHSSPQQNPRTGYWNRPRLLAQDRARLRKTDLFHGGTAALFEKVNLRRIEPVVLKGHKREQQRIDRVNKIKAAMADMDSRIEEHHKLERARRVRPGFFQLITGKKPSGVVAAEEAAAKERKEKMKALEKARQAAQTK